MLLAILFNPISGSGRALAVAERLRQGLESGGIAVRLIPSERGALEEWLRPKLRDVTTLVVAGGDGSVRLAAGEAARAGIPIWHAPCGTENLFARAFAMTRSPRDVTRALIAGRTRAIDLGCVGAEHFTIMASVGFDAEVVHELGARRTGKISHLSYLTPILRLFRDWKPSALAWTIDGEHEALGRGVVVVGNLPNYGVRLNPAAEALPDDRALDAVYIPAESALGLLPWVPLLRTGLHLWHPRLRVRRARSIVLHATPAARLQLDGDPVGRAPMTETVLSVSPHALLVLLPHSAPVGG
jgi:diacylglycerol kinase (ATP)